MKRNSFSSRRLGVESLEPRMVQAQFGIAWNDSMHLSMSFVPDQTAVADLRSNLMAALDAQMPRAVWQAAILRAAQAWMQVANVNIGLSSDGGQPLGNKGPTQGDSRYGDIRIGGYRMDQSVMAVSIPPGDTSGTFAGDIFVNTAARFTPESLQATMLHEFGHALGLGHSTNPQSVMFSHLNNQLQLATSDISAIRALYGSRTVDNNEIAKSNNTLATATRIKYSQVSSGYDGSTPLVTWGDLTTAADVDFFYVPSLLGYTGPITFRLQTTGLSFVTPKLTVTDRLGKVLGQKSSTTSSSDTLTIQIPNATPDARYYIRVESLAGATHRVGRYAVAVTFDGRLKPTAIPLQTVIRGNYESVAPEKVDLLFKNPNSILLDDDLHTNDNPTTAVNLRPTAGQTDRRLSVQGSLTDSTDVDYYRVRTPTTGTTWVLTATVQSSGPNPILPRVVIEDTTGVAVAAQVIANGNGTFSIQASGLPANKSYLLKVSSPTLQTGNYTLFASFGTVRAELQNFVSSQVTNIATPITTNLFVARPQLLNFNLGAEGLFGSVTMTIRDAAGAIVEQLTARAQTISSSISRLLAPGKYTVTFTATAAQRFTLRGSQLSDPVGPVIDSTTLHPQYTSPTNPNVYVYPDGTSSNLSYYWLVLAVV